MPKRLSLEQVAKPDECAWITERFARRLSQPVSDVRDAVRSLRESGVLQSCGSLGDTDHPSYWLSEDSTLFSALGELLEAYSASPDRRRGLLRAIRYCPAGTP